MEAFCKELPKCDLHVHLNGSLRDSTVKELFEKKYGGVTPEGMFEMEDYHIVQDRRSLDDCFSLFRLIHMITSDVEAIRRVTREVIEDFNEENVVYLELRTTPKDNEKTGLTKEDYVNAVVETIDECNADSKIQTITRLLLSIDRRTTSENALEIVRLATKFHSRRSPNGGGPVVLGIDFSGDPSQGNFQNFILPLELARGAGLALSVHFAEIKNDKESQRILSLTPNRLAHAVCLTATLRQGMLNKKPQIPLEICLTSNLKSGSVKDLADHQFKAFYDDGYPVVLCTDDKGAFQTSLTEEYVLAAEQFGLSNAQLFDLSEKALDYVFCQDQVTLNKLRARFVEARKSMKESGGLSGT